MTHARGQSMSARSAVTQRPRQKRKRRSAAMRFWPRAQLRRRWWRKFRDAPPGVRYLLGAGTGEIFARRRFRLDSGQRCGEHDVQAYVVRVDQLKKRFARLEGK